MSLNRRQVLAAMAGSYSAMRQSRGQGVRPVIAAGPFDGTRESLQLYRIPEWFRDAKFGIWAHWGPESAPEYGDWYARNMYIEGSRQYKYHLEHYGHPSKFGYKDVIPTWKAQNFDADHLVGLYAKAGAKYFFSMGVHHDNFDMWDSKYQRWNAVNMGAKRDIVGLFRKAARDRGLRFGVSEHLWPSYSWFSVAKGHDTTGQFAGVPYDGADPKYADLYLDRSDIPAKPFETSGVPESWKRRWFLRIQDLVDRYQPDILYTDGGIPYDEWGLNLVAHHYNQSAKRTHGAPDVVYTSKNRKDCETGTCALDLERGIVDSIWPSPWQTDTCVGNWHYDKTVKYKTPKTVIDMLVDIVSRNGNLLLNFPLRSDGTLDPEEEKIVAEITTWMAVNSEAIYGTRPWRIFGEGPGTQDSAQGGGGFNERKRKPLTAEDVRFTTKGDVLYAFFMGWPEKQAVVAQRLGKVRNVQLLGYAGKLAWSQDERGLTAQLPDQKPCDHACVLKITA